MIELDLTVYAGDTQVITAQFISPIGNAVDLDSAHIQWVMTVTRQSDVDGRVIDIDTATSDDITIEDPTTGIFSILISHDRTRDLDEGIYYHEAKVVEQDGTATTVFTGTVTLIRGPLYTT